MATVSSSPNKPRPADPLVIAVADALRRTEVNYDREGSGPGSRFEGRLLEDVQAEMAVRMILSQVPSPDQRSRLAALATEALNVAEHLAHVLNSAEALDRVNGVRRRLAGEPQ